MLRLLLATALVLLPLAGCIGETFEPVVAAGWQPGYAYHFESLESGTQSIKEFENGTETSSKSSTETDEKRKTSYQVLSVDDIEDAESFAIVITDPLTSDAELGAYRLSDLAQAGARIDDGKLRIYSFGELGSGPVRFPLQPGATWEYEESEDEGFRGTATVEGSEMVDGPSGKVTAIRIRHDITVDEEVFRVKMQAEQIEAGNRDVEASVFVEATRTVWFAPSLHNIVKDETTAEFTYDVAYTTPEGTKYQAIFEGTYEGSERLTGATFAVGEDLDVLGMLKALEVGAHPGAIVANPDIPAGATSLRLTGPGATVGLETGSTLTVEVAAKGLTAPIAVKLTGPEGERTTQVAAAGGKASFGVEQAGLYQWTATSTGEDARISASHNVAVRLEDSVPVVCPVAGVMNVCDPLTFRLGEGLDSLTVSVKRTAVVIEPGSGTLTVEGPEDQDEANMLGQSAEVRFESPAKGNWNVGYEYNGLPGELTYNIVGSVEVPKAPTTAMKALFGWT